MRSPPAISGLGWDGGGRTEAQELRNWKIERFKKERPSFGWSLFLYPVIPKLGFSHPGAITLHVDIKSSVCCRERELENIIVYMTNHRYTTYPTFQRLYQIAFFQCAGDSKNKDRDSRETSREGWEEKRNICKNRGRYGFPSEFESCSQRGSLSTVESTDLPSFKEQALQITPISHTACVSRASAVCGSCWDHDCYYLLLFLSSHKYMFLNPLLCSWTHWG